MRDAALAEIAGMNGAFTFPELLLQRIWHRGEFATAGLRTRDGRALRLLRRGTWNRLGGPDFADAELEFGEGAGREPARGAVEVHLRAADWDAHGHAADPAYANVVLHVVLFPSMREWTAGAGGRRIPILELLPLLERDLEAYAEEAAVEGLAGRPYGRLRELLGRADPAELRAGLRDHALRRWAAKARLAESRIERLGWEGACHHTALEVLGYRFNRAPMLATAEAWPLSAWRTGAAGPEAALAARAGDWRRAGVRPANQPRARLAQYARWVAARPDWPDRLAESGERWLRGRSESGPAEVKAERAALGLARWREELAEAVCGGELGGTRFDTWICDGALPLLAARTGAAGAAGFFARAWLIWRPGDVPEELSRLAREIVPAGGGREVLAQGDLQGLLGWLARLAEIADQQQGRGA